MNNDTIKVKATEYALRAQISLNTVKNRIRAGVLKGAKEEDGIWYVYLSEDEWEHIRSLEDSIKPTKQLIEKNIEELGTNLEGKLIATYMNALMQSQEQKERLLHELSSLQTLLAIRENKIEQLEKEVEILKYKNSEAQEVYKKTKEENETLRKEVSSLLEKIRKLEQSIERAEIECQRKLLEKEQAILLKEIEIAKLKEKESN
ncbi:MAG: hypothetical protein NZL90_04725 [Aquificaceae bacterium]|nr:hypothetical protein [Aquificaceae bacterium]MDW8237842.1 hypothetical protein [Aquificaceae bacterium]